MDTKQLRQKILDLAIHGKIVPQDPNDEPASVLLERIKAEKERLVKEGKIKKSRKSTNTSDTPHYENVPFEVPEGWVWCKLEELAFIGTGATPSTKNKAYYNNGKIAWVNSSATNMPFISSASNFITDTAIKETNCVVYPVGTLIIAMYGEGKTRGKISELKIEAATNQACAAIIPYEQKTKSYLKYCFEANYLHIRTLAEGGNQPNLNLGKISSYGIYLPPISEQHRIVAEIERWFSLIDIIENGKSDLQTTIKQTKSKILDLAIHGELVPQDPNDEPAIELLKRINLSFTPCDNGHDKKLPQNWTWAKGENIFLPMKSTKPKGEKFQYIDIDSIDNKRQIISEVKTLKTSNAPSRASRYTQKNDVIFSMVRPYLRNIAKVNSDNCIASTGFYVCSPNPRFLNSDYCFYLMISDYVVNGLNQFMKGDNSPSINKGHIDEWLFPLPPLEEQQRIAQKIEELFSVLDDIQNALEV